MKKYWIIENEMYSAYDSHTITNLFYGTWFEAARECVNNTGVKGNYRSVKEFLFNDKESGCITNNYL